MSVLAAIGCVQRGDVNLKAKGTRIEREAKAALEAVGYTVVRAAGSHGLFDLVAIHPSGVRLIQMKANKPPGPLERESLQAFKAPPGATVEIWVRRDGDTQPEITVVSRG